MAQHRAIASKSLVLGALVLQFIPLVLFPAESFTSGTQEWWLPVLLAVLAVWADVELIVRHNDRAWPWDLIAFSHGFNIISRIMMLWPHATHMVNKVSVLNGPYIVLTFVAIALSAAMLWYSELPGVRMRLLQD